MRIGIDMLGDQSAGRTRGVGRYTRGLVSRLLENTSHEFVLYYHGGLPRRSHALLPSVGNALCGVPQSTGDVAPPLDGTPRRAFPTEVCELESCVGGGLHLPIERLARSNPDRLDVLLLTCPLENFQGYLPPFPSRGGVKLAAIVYDLIPLIYPESYLRHPGIAAAYRRAVCALPHYDLLLTISQSAREEVLRRLGVRGDRVVNIGAGSDRHWFKPVTNEADRQADTACLTSLGIREPFIYSLTALDFRKNLSGLLAALEHLPKELRELHQIVLSCAASGEEEIDQCRSLISRSAIADRVLLMTSIDDTALRALYRRAAAFLFPSRHEGFGLPLLEAMQCGAVVVAGHNSSQIEVVGEAGLLADVDDAAALASQIARSLSDTALAARLRDAAVRQAEQFSWQATADRLQAALEAACTAPRAATWPRVFAARARLAAAERVKHLSIFAPRKNVLSRSERRRGRPAPQTDVQVDTLNESAGRAMVLAGISTE
ncbi:MAG TPA: glycosyltransferase family 1 protein [Pirellulales bacterium]|nr:glycosyltransferase family 1 protein [Pirellulales bacterium]